MAQFAKLTAVQAAIINSARTNANSDDERKQIKREVFSVVKDKYGIPSGIAVKANTTGTHQPGYLVLHDKQGCAFALGDDGKFDGTLVPPTPKAEPLPPVAAGWSTVDTSNEDDTDDNSDNDTNTQTSNGMPLPDGVTVHVVDHDTVVVRASAESGWSVDANEDTGRVYLTRD